VKDKVPISTVRHRMHRSILALTVLLHGCASSPSSRETCDFVAESSRLGVTPLEISASEKMQWLKEVGLSTARYRSTHWYQGGDGTRLVCLYRNACNADAAAYRKNGTGWEKIEPPDRALLCVLVTPNKDRERTRER
jgi:hypothetical protein